MRGLGAALFILGAGSLVLPKLGIPLAIRFVPAEYQLHASIGCAVVGAALFLLSLRRKKEKKA